MSPGGLEVCVAVLDETQHAFIGRDRERNVDRGRDLEPFILRLSVDAGRLSGVVERVRTGEKGRFHGIEELGPLIVQMLESETEPG
ncbi:MAG: hypothetical protein HYU41_10755 [Candidatus Rokubacteria bacterium]|nr:hypothetical protein [Candidatus Rokubacteria bacterium]